MSNMSYPEDTPTWRVFQIRDIRADSEADALEFTSDEIAGFRKVDTGEHRHTAGGRVLAAAAPVNTVNGALQAAAVLLLEASAQEGDDGTGGTQTREDIEKAIRFAQEALHNLD